MDISKKTTTTPDYFSTFNKFMEEYFAFVQNQQQSGGDSKGLVGKGAQNLQYEPVFIPLCTYPVLPYYPPGSPAPSVDRQDTVPVYQPLPFQTGNNAYILFLIFILLLLGTKKEQILAAINSILNG
ncbi:MAG: hypothetical protein PHD36_02080 [Desulfotomaculaceae bacterium]|nr:hypothetical protein [Desulfotomaculaceae bacterium]